MTQAGLDPRALAGTLELGEVTSVQDPDGLNRVQIRLLSRGPQTDHASNQDQEDATLWAVVAVPFAGDSYGTFFIPDVGTRVVVSFLNNDPRYPVVLGSLWDGTTASPETLGGSGDEVDRWTLTGKAGTRIAIVEESGQAKILLETPGGNKIEIDDSASAVKVTQGGNTVTLDSGGIKLDSHTVEINAATFRLSASMANFDAPLANFSGIVMCSTMQTNSVLSPSYTPGAGNML